MNNQELTILILKITIMCNAMTLGWDVRHVNNKEVIITKKLNKMTDIDHDTVKLLNAMTQNDVY